MRLVEVLQYDGYVHVDDDHVADDDETGEVRDGQDGMSAVAIRQPRRLGLAVRRLHHQRLEDVVPAGRSH